MQKNKAIPYSSVFIIALQVCSYNHAMIPEKAIQLESEITQITTDIAGKTLVQSIPTICLAYKLVDLSLKAKSHAFPTMEEREQALLTTDQLKSAQLCESFTKCLIDNPKSSCRGSLGIPEVCEDVAWKFAKQGTTEEVEAMIACYKHFNN